MSLRNRVGRVLRPVAGNESIDRLSRREFETRRRLAQRIDPSLIPRPPEPDPPAPEIEPLAEFPEPSMTRHDFLTALHRLTKPRTYLEVGVNDGLSLALSRCRTIGVDPGFVVRSEVHCDLRLFRETSDDFFAREAPTSHFGGLPIDLAFVDGMHLAEFAYRDFLNLERLCGAGSVVVMDDMLPRSTDEAARERHTIHWAGDVYKILSMLRELRPDLIVVPVNTDPTGLLLITGLDPSSNVLSDAYQGMLPGLQSPDPQDVPEEIRRRRCAVDAKSVLASKAWNQLVELRASDAGRAEVRRAVIGLNRLKRLG